MSGLELSISAFAVMLGAMFLRIPIGVSMAITGFTGTWIVFGSPNAVLAQLKSLTYDTFSSYSLSMRQFATKSGMSRDLLRATAD